jgi:alanyl-tRNA synthetase
MTSNELRQAFLNYFKNHQHTIVTSSPLVPGNDPTLLFTNAGMVQFKDVFLGLEKRSYARATTAQRCVRAGGKHNDLENVGYTARHHTFFEMLGNFSFGDYFKREAIVFAWDFLTNVLKIPKEKLWVTVFTDDNEAADIWLQEIKVDPQRFSHCGAEDNFWAMGDTGPCGPCTEIFYDHGPEIPGGPPGTPEADGDRYIEIWNLVFMQYERSADGKLTPLPKPSVDTGMGLERLAAVMQGVHNNYDTDLFGGLIESIKKIINLKDINEKQITSLRVIADHIRSCSFLITDGVIPSNEGRGYVLRRIIRRAIRHGNQLGFTEPFFHKLVAPLVKQMGVAYPELSKAQKQIERVLLQEEQQFARTLETGLKVLEQDIAKLSGKIIPGETVFRLYDTYGFPVDLTADIARERNLEIDTEGFEEEMAKQRQKSQEASRFGVDYTERLTIEQNTEFMGYEHLTHEATIVALFCNGKPADSLQTVVESAVVLDHTPFYAEGGGQVGDKGWLMGANGQFEVLDTRKEGQVFLHYGRLKQGTLQTGDKVHAEVDQQKRQATALNHSATHLLHAALHKILGEHAVQKGSLVEPERLRFDFTHFAPLTAEEIKAVEYLVNQKIRANLPVDTHVMTPEDAKQQGALAFFGEKYGEHVRVLSMGNFSKELCGGTHVKRTGDIGFFKIITETGIAAGVRRIEAVTGEYALTWVDIQENQLNAAAQLLKTGQEGLLEKIKKNIERTQQLEKQLEQLHNRLTGSAGEELLQQAVVVQGVKILTAAVGDLDAKRLRDMVDHLKDKLGSAIIVLGSKADDRAQLVVGVTKDLVARIKAGDLINHIAADIGGKGGGRPDFAQAGGNNVQGIEQALQKAQAWLEKELK